VKLHPMYHFLRRRRTGSQ